MNTLCESEVLAHKISDNPDTAHVEEGIKIKPVNVGMSLYPCVTRKYPDIHRVFFLLIELEEDGVRIALTIVDTPGFGDNIDNEFACVFLNNDVEQLLTFSSVFKRSSVTWNANTTTS